MAASRQWAVKVCVVFAAAIVLGTGLPGLLVSGLESAGANTTPFNNWEPALVAVMLLAAGSLYVSSLCRSGLWALLMSMPALVGSAFFLQLIVARLGHYAYTAVRSLAGNPMPRFRPFYYIPPRALAYLLIAGVIALALRFAFINHRSADRPAKRVWMQVIVMAAFVAVGIIVGGAWQAFRR